MRALLLGLLAFTLSPPLAAQVTASVGVALPVGPFGRADAGAQDGFAEPGFAALLLLDAPFAPEGTRGLAFSGTLGVLVFPSDSDGFSPFSPAEQPGAAPSSKSAVGSWIAVPVTAGLRYEWAGMSDDVALIGMLQGGVGIVRLPGASYEFQGDVRPLLLEREWGMTATLAAGAGVSVALYDRLEIGVHALWFGSPSFTVDQTLTTDTPPETTEVELERPIAAAAFTLGYRF